MDVIVLITDECLDVFCLFQVSAYGFITPDFMNYSDHYFDKIYRRLHFYVNHDMRMEMVLWQQLHQAGLIRLYMRDLEEA